MRKIDTSAGKYNKRISIKRVARTANAYNEQVPDYDTEYIKRWAYVVPQSGREFMAAQAVHTQLSLIIRVRSDSKTRAITTDMVVELGNKTLNIGSIFDEQEARKEVVIYCIEAE